MNAMVALKVILLLAVGGVFYCATFHPDAYTYSGVSSLNGSDSNVGCPSNCRMTAHNEKFCDCTGMISDTPGVLIDGIPTIDVNERGTWASPLYTVDVAASSYVVGFRFRSAIILREVELHLFFCPPWGIPNSRLGLTINIQRSLGFPLLIAPRLVGTINLTQLNSDCDSLIRVSITTQTPARTIYFIEFMSSSTLGELYIGEVIFRDEIEVFTTASVTSTILPHTNRQTTSIQSTSLPQTRQPSTSLYQSDQPKSVGPATKSTSMSIQLNRTAKSTYATSNDYRYESTSASSLSHSLETKGSSDPTISILPNTLIPIVAGLISVILSMAVIMAIGFVVCLYIIRRKSSSPKTEQDRNENDGYEDIDNYVKTEVPNIELMDNQAYDIVKRNV